MAATAGVAGGAGGLLQFGFHVSVASLLWFVYSNSDFAIVGKMLGPVELGLYALAFQLISLPVQKLTANINQVAYPVYCRLQGDPARLRDWFLRLTVMYGFLGIPALVGLALVAPDAFRLILGEKWLPAVLPFQMLTGVGVVMLYSASLPPLLNSLGRPDINLRYTAACTLLLPASFLAGGYLAGLQGICLAWLLLFPLIVAALVVCTRSITGIGLLALLRVQVPVIGAVMVMAVVVLIVQGCLNSILEPWLRLVAAISAGAVSYAGVMLLLARRTVLADLLALWREMRGTSERGAG